MRTVDPRLLARERARRVRARRAMLYDLLLGLAIALFVLLVLSPGLGIVASFGVPVLIVGAVWLLGERLWSRLRHGTERPPSPT